MIKVDFKAIDDFIKCPLLYKFRYIDKVETDKKDADEKLQESLVETVQDFYKKILDEDKVMSFKQLRVYWSDTFYKDKDKYDIIGRTSFNKSHDPKNTRRFIKNFIDRYETNPGTPIGVEVGFEVKLPKMVVTGQLPVIRKINGKVDLLYIDSTFYNPDEFRADNYLFFTVMSYAYRKLFGEKEDQISYYNGYKDKLLVTTRDENDYKKDFVQIENIATIIKNNLFYQDYSYSCKSCPYQWECDHWDGKK